MRSKKMGRKIRVRRPSLAPGMGRGASIFAFSPEIRHVIYATNAVESLNGVIRKSVKTRGSFPSEDAAEKLT